MLLYFPIFHQLFRWPHCRPLLGTGSNAGCHPVVLVRWQFGKIADLDVIADVDVAGVEVGEEDELAPPVLPRVPDDAVKRDPIKLVQNPTQK